MARKAWIRPEIGLEGAVVVRVAALFGSQHGSRRRLRKCSGTIFGNVIQDTIRHAGVLDFVNTSEHYLGFVG